jgi:hypothetical protein
MESAELIFIRPGVQVNAIERDPLRADRDDTEMRTDVAIEAVFIHSQIGRCIAKPQESGGCVLGRDF